MIGDGSPPSPARGSSIRRCWPGSATSSWSRARSSTGSSTACTASPFFGASVDFAEHRGYVAGDDIRRVDWRLYARTDRYLHQGVRGGLERQLLGAARRLASRWASAAAAMTKLDYARMLAGCLTYLVHRQRDRVGFVAFDDDIVEHVPPSAKHMDVVLHVLDRLQAGEAGQPARAAAQDGRALRPARHAGAHFGFLRGAGRGARGDRAAAVPRQRPRSCSICSTRPSSISRFTTPSAFEDLESGEQIPVVPDALAEQYRELVQAHIDGADRAFSATASTTRCVNTSRRSITRCSVICRHGERLIAGARDAMLF